MKTSSLRPIPLVSLLTLLGTSCTADTQRDGGIVPESKPFKLNGNEVSTTWVVEPIQYEWVTSCGDSPTRDQLDNCMNKDGLVMFTIYDRNKDQKVAVYTQPKCYSELTMCYELTESIKEKVLAAWQTRETNDFSSLQDMYSVE